MSGIPKVKSGTQRDILAPYAIMARKEAEQRSKKTTTLDPLHTELHAKLYKQPYQRNQPLIANIKVTKPETLLKKRIVKTQAPLYNEPGKDVLGQAQVQKAMKSIKSGRPLTVFRITPRFIKTGIGSPQRDEGALAASQAAPGRTRRGPNLGGKKKRRKTRKKRKRRKRRKRRKTRNKRKRKRRRSRKK